MDECVYDRGLTQKLLDLTSAITTNSRAKSINSMDSVEENAIQIMMSDDDDALRDVLRDDSPHKSRSHLSTVKPPRIGEGDSMSTTLSLPVHDEALQHQTETVSNVSVYDDMHPLDPQDDDGTGTVDDDDDDSPLPRYPKYDAFHREHYEELVIVTASETSSRSGRVNLPGPERSNSSSLTNNNVSNNHDSDVMNAHSDDSDRSAGPPVYAVHTPSDPNAVHTQTRELDGGNGVDKGDEMVSTYSVSEAEHGVFKSLQNKLIEMDDFHRNYLGLRHCYLTLKRKRNRECRVQLNRAKHRIARCFYEIYLVLQQQQDTLLRELEEEYASKKRAIQEMDEMEVDRNCEIQKSVREHMSSLSRSIDEYQSRTNDPSGCQ